MPYFFIVFLIFTPSWVMTNQPILKWKSPFFNPSLKSVCFIFHLVNWVHYLLIYMHYSSERDKCEWKLMTKINNRNHYQSMICLYLQPVLHKPLSILLSATFIIFITIKTRQAIHLIYDTWTRGFCPVASVDDCK